MSKCLNFLNFIHVALMVSLIQFSYAAPIGDLYSQFVNEMNSENCAMPSKIKLPFNITAGVNVDPLSPYLKICQNVEKGKHEKEVVLLCNEVFAILKNITCLSDFVPSSEISLSLPKDVCAGFQSLQISVPDEQKSILRRLTDPVVCDFFCAEEFEKACQVLLWSYEVQKIISDSKKLDSASEAAKEEKSSNDLQDHLEDHVTEAGPAKSKPVPGNDKSDIAPNAIDTSTIAKGMSQEAIPPKSETTLASSHNEDTAPAEAKVNTSPVIKTTEKQKLSTSDTETKPTGPNDAPAIEKDLLGAQTKAGTVEVKSTTSSDLKVENAHGIDHAEELGEIKPEVRPDKESIVHQEDPAPLDNVPAEPKSDANTASDILNDSEKPSKPENSNQSKPLDDINGNAPKEQSKPVVLANGTTESATVRSDKQAITEKEINDAVPAEKVPNETEAKLPTIGSLDQKVTTNDELHSEDPISVPVAYSSTDGPITAETIPIEKMDEEGEIPPPLDKNEIYSEGGSYEPSKNKESNLPELTPKVHVSKAAVDEIDKSFNDFPSRESLGRVPDDIQVIAAFPDPEDSHFFFYFLTIVLVIMAGYLIFHNKQKIIALIVEGRHERRRRSHGVGYKKLETK